MSAGRIAKLTARNVRPVYAHDCNICIFLGALNGNDLYFCPAPSPRDESSVIARFGARDEEYKSLPEDSVSHLPVGSILKFVAVLTEKYRKTANFVPNAYVAE
jgi:hypothetical protein